MLSADLTHEIERRNALENSDDENKVGKLHVQNLKIEALETVARELETCLLKQKLHDQISSERVKVIQPAFIVSDP